MGVFNIIDLAATASGNLLLAHVTDEALLGAATQFNTASKEPGNSTSHTAYLRSRAAFFLAALEFRRAFEVMRTEILTNPCECPDCTAKRAPGAGQHG